MVWIILIVAGLFLDGVGAILFVKPFLHKIALNPRKSSKEKAEKLESTRPRKEKIKDAKFVWWGVGLLIFGFILQIIGNIVQALSNQ